MSNQKILRRNKHVFTFVSSIKRSILCMASIISPELNTKLAYKLELKESINLRNPYLFNEKILWLKLNNYIHNPLVVECADKYKVRDYVKRCGCEEILNDLVGVYDSVDDIPWAELPNRYVLKWNFGAGMNIVCKDNHIANHEEYKNQMKKWGGRKFWLIHSEMHYKYIDRKIVCERYLEDNVNDTIPDYKIYCFNGVPRYILVCHNRVHLGNKIKAEYVFFDTQWNLKLFSRYSKENQDNISIEQPKSLTSMLEYAKILAKPFPFVRADFYDVNGKVYFGELTFTPCCGLDDDLGSGNIEMGNLLDLHIPDVV